MRTGSPRSGTHTPAILIIRDGWGENPHISHDSFNAVRLARTPVDQQLKHDWPWTLIKTSGEDVGLNDGTVGNSEVGHQNIGAGRIVDQMSVKITKAVRDRSFFSNPALVDGITRARAADGRVHILGLASNAGVHSLLNHLYASVELCRELGMYDVVLHLFTDGRDSGPFSGEKYLAEIETQLKEIGVGRIASICGRYYAMDRDNRWERIERAYLLLTGTLDRVPTFATAIDALKDYYVNPTSEALRSDEFVTPRVVGDAAPIHDNDTVIFFNFRGDRPRELTRAFVMDKFFGCVKPSPDSGKQGFDRGMKVKLSSYITMTSYEDEIKSLVSVAFERPPKMANIMGEYVSDHERTQFRCAETEKYPHVTYFFNDYRDSPFPGEHRTNPQSPRVATYDQSPEMAADEVCQAVLDRLHADDCEDVLIVNFANADMVGHTGRLDACIVACEKVDECVGRIVDAALAKHGNCIVTADHGNAEQMWNPDTDSPHTAHTMYDVACIVIGERFKGAALRGDTNVDGWFDPGTRELRGRLADLVPTLLHMMGMDQPKEMTGRSLIL